MHGHCLLRRRLHPLTCAVGLILAGSGSLVLADEVSDPLLADATEAVIDGGQEAASSSDASPDATDQDPAAGRKEGSLLTPPTHLEVGPVTLNVTPGVNVLVEIAIDQLNRILTPFPNPQVRTVAEASTSVDGSAVYLATSSEVPITLFISDASDPNHALSLTLAPRRIPPRELRLVLSDPLPLSAQISAPVTTPEVRTNAPAPEYVERLTEALRALAHEELPEGFGLRPARADESVDCGQAGIVTRPGQVLDGQDLRLVTVLASNHSGAPLEIEERACRALSGYETLAVAAWPSVWLEPGETVELYLVVRITPPERVHPPRPSLLGAESR
ncbi:hypothetical protein ThidrDRAFT_1177 [Thiorhodococcus drewsii AZ1]|uniref:TraK C-terminal domain-containing protein n=1 Tax=Thiorhodococcus drewsii AZ1 TaxID=765913 RepID=G2DYR5_9GAMM|nr:type-F conjugative transfer system secretin TraK [Thiorhodococcus drewsii]EGV32692.1 hypothetical protein ThidrDRAFT_1177 [Thiorhodococcus drewsii AZ1]